MLAAMPSEARPPAIQDAVAQTMGNQMALLSFRTSYAAGSDPARDLVRRIARGIRVGKGAARDRPHRLRRRLLQLVRDNAPGGRVMWFATYVVLFLLLGSIPAAPRPCS